MILKFNNTRIHFLKEKHSLSRLPLLSFLLLSEILSVFYYNYVRLLEIMNNFKLIFFVKVEKTDSNIYNNNLLLHYLSCSHYHFDH